MFQYRSPQSSEIASRIIIDLRDSDQRFIEDMAGIFQVNYGLDREGSWLLREYTTISVSEIVALYSMNPTTLYGTLNQGPDERQYRGLLGHPEKEIEEFAVAYKSFAVRLSAILATHLESYQNKAIAKGYSDVSCSVAKYIPGSLLLNMRGIQPFPTQSRRGY